MQGQFSVFVGDLRRSFFDLGTIIAVVLIFQLVVLRSIPTEWPSLLFGLVVVGVGLALFMRGLELGLFPIGEELATHLAHASTRFWLIVFAFVIGFSTAVAEPALIAIAHKAVAVSGGVLDGVVFRIIVGISVGIAVVLGILRILWQHPIHWYFIAGYLVTLAITPFAPTEIIGIAYDSGGVTTSTVTVPMLAALGIGLATALKSKNPVIDGFGLVSFAALVPISFVQLYGIYIYTYGTAATTATALQSFGAATFSAPHGLDLVYGFFASSANLLPVVLTILFFFGIVLRKRIAHMRERIFGFVLVALGLYAFVIGLEIGLFPIGETISIALAESGNLFALYSFAFLIGFATTVAEPSLTAVARKAEEVSGGAIDAFVLRMVVATGVGAGILLGAYRIVNGDVLGLYIIAGYTFVILLTFVAPRSIIPIAFDSGGVTTSTVTVPILTALGLGLATTLPGRDPLIDGFGLIALASIFPITTVLLYGIGEQQNIRRHERYTSSLTSAALAKISETHSPEHYARETHIKKQIITIAGVPGSGATTIGKRVAELLHYRYFSSGDIFRKIAEERGVHIDDLALQAERESHIDYEIDLVIQTLGESTQRMVINARLGYHWIHSSFKVHLRVSPEIAARRLATPEQQDSPEALRTIEREITDRVLLERTRYLEHYGIDTANTKPFHLQIDTGARDVESVAREIVAAYTTWVGAKR